MFHTTLECAPVRAGSVWCRRCDVLVGLEGVHVEDVERRPGLLQVTVSSPGGVTGCPGCGVVAVGRGRRRRLLHDVPGTGRVVIVWRQRVWRCVEGACPVGTFVEQLPELVQSRRSITQRAITWAIGQLRREHATVSGLARQLGVSWKTLWKAIEPELVRMAQCERRYENVTTLGVDEHLWHHGDTRRKGPKELTGMVDLSRDVHGHTHARLLDLVPGRSKKAYADWLSERGASFRSQIQIAALDPFGGYKAAIDEQLADVTAVLDAFHVIKLGTTMVDEVRRRVQHATLGRRGRKGDPLYGIQTILRAGAERLTDRQFERLATAIEAHPAHDEVYIALRCAQDLRAAYRTKNTQAGKTRALKILDDFHTCPILRSRPPGPDPTPLERRIPGLLHHRPHQQRRHRSHL